MSCANIDNLTSYFPNLGLGLGLAPEDAQVDHGNPALLFHISAHRDEQPEQGDSNLAQQHRDGPRSVFCLPIMSCFHWVTALTILYLPLAPSCFQQRAGPGFGTGEYTEERMGLQAEAEHWAGCVCRVWPAYSRCTVASGTGWPHK